MPPRAPCNEPYAFGNMPGVDDIGLMPAAGLLSLAYLVRAARRP
jgi:hypothetical protein